MSRQTLFKVFGMIFAGILAGCFFCFHMNERKQSCTEQLFAMDTFMIFTACGRDCEEAVEEAIWEVQRLDALWSTGSADSEVSRVNASGSGELSEDSRLLLERALEIHKETGGLFDPTIYPLMQLWGFPTQEYHVPTDAELKEALSLVDASKVQYDGASVTLEEKQKIDFGGIAKGYTSARIMEIFRSHGIRSGMVSLGGNVQTIGKKPDGTRWQIGIQDPDSTQGEVLAVVEAEDQAVITSGGYERYFEEDGNTYIHIIDPRTGYPADGDLKSVTIVSGDGTLADALSTSLYIMGYDGAVEYWKAHSEAFDMVLVTDQGGLYVTEGLRDRFRSETDPVILNRDLSCF